MGPMNVFPGVCLIIPVRDEVAVIDELCAAVLLAQGAGADVLIVDDASTDGTTERLEALRGAGVHIIRTDRSLGFGAAIRAGLDAAPQQGYLAWLPGSMRVHPLFAVALAHELHRRAVYGTAYVKARRLNRPWQEALPSRAAGVVLSLLGRGSFLEVGGTPTVVPVTARDALLLGPDGVEFETETIRLLRRDGLQMLRLAIPFGPRKHGHSHWNRGLRSQLSLLYRLARRVIHS